MKKVFLLIVIPALLIALGFAQTPAASSNTDQINVQGCLGGSEGKYTVVEDDTGQIFKITTSSADLKPHLGHDVKLIGHKAGGAVSSGAAENSLAVTELNMISEHCTAAAAAPAATVSTPEAAAAAPTAAPAATVSMPEAAAAAPTAAPAATVSTPEAAAAAPTATPAATVSTPSEIVSTPTAAAATPTAAPAATVSTPGETVSTPAAAAVQPTRSSARPRKLPATPATDATAAAPTETVSTPAAAAPAAAAGTPSETASTPAEAATKPATSARGGSLWMLVSLVVVVLVIGALVPLFNRWRKRRLLEQTSAQNLSFTKEASSDQGKTDKSAGPKAA